MSRVRHIGAYVRCLKLCGMQVASPKLSSYAEGLSSEAKTRYIAKIALIDGIDSFEKVTAGEPCSGVPPVEACNLVSYVV